MGGYIWRRKEVSTRGRLEEWITGDRYEKGDVKKEETEDNTKFSHGTTKYEEDDVKIFRREVSVSHLQYFSSWFLNKSTKRTIVDFHITSISCVITLINFG